MYMFLLPMFLFILGSSCLYFYDSLFINSLSLSLYFSSESILFYFTLMIIFFSILGFSWTYFGESLDFIRFLVIFSSFSLSMVLLIFHSSVFTLLLSWDGLGVSSFFLVAYYMNWSSINGALVTILTNRFGDFCLFWFFSSLVFSYSWKLSICAPLLFIVGAFTKSAQFPFSNWLPLAMAAPTPVSSLVHSSTLVTAGVYIIFRHFFLFETTQFLNFMIILSIATIFVAGTSSLVEMDLKKVVALSTLSQMGFLIFSMGAGLPLLGFFHLLSHAFFKSCLFIQVGGAILKSFGSQESRIFSSYMKSSPVLSIIMLGCCISLCGQVFFSGFFSKEWILLSFSMLSISIFIYIMAWLGVVFTFLYSFRVVWGFFNKNLNNLSSENDSGLVFFSSILFFFGVFGGYMFMMNTNSFIFLYLSMEKFVPLMVLFTIFTLFLNFSKITKNVPGMFFLDFLVSSMPATMNKISKIMDFSILSSLTFSSLNMKMMSSKMNNLLSSYNLFILFMFLGLMLMF